MTRLNSTWMAELTQSFHQLNTSMEQSFGCDLLALAAQSCGHSEAKLKQKLSSKKASIIPITSGEGIIGNFAQSIALVLKFMGCPASITDKNDVAGMAQALTKRSDIIFMGDDEIFMAMDPAACRYVDNHPATAKGFAQLAHLKMQSSGVNHALVVGYGPLGKLIAAELDQKGCDVSICDKNPLALTGAPEKFRISNSLQGHRIIVDATSQGSWLDETQVDPQATIIAPGVPISLKPNASKQLKERYFHDYLAIGVAVMIAELM